MSKVLVLQKFHGLSDDATQEQIFDRTSFKAFLGQRNDREQNQRMPRRV